MFGIFWRFSTPLIQSEFGTAFSGPVFCTHVSDPELSVPAFLVDPSRRVIEMSRRG